MKTRNIFSTTLAAAVLSVGFAGAASAAVINFDQRDQGPTGQLSYDGNGGALIGQDISFSFLSSDGFDRLSCNSCHLNFATGNNLNEGDTYTFGGGGSFELTGSVATQGGDAVASGSLLNGTFASGSAPTFNKFGPQSGGFMGSGTNTLDGDLAAFYGIDSNSIYNFLTTEFSLGGLSFDGNGGFTGNVTAADLQAENMNDVPEPSELAMFALGGLLLVGGIAIRRRRSAGRDLIG